MVLTDKQRDLLMFLILFVLIMIAAITLYYKFGYEDPQYKGFVDPLTNERITCNEIMQWYYDEYIATQGYDTKFKFNKELLNLSEVINE